MKLITEDWKNYFSDDLLLAKSYNNIIIGFWPVIFGCRVRAEIIGNDYYDIDYCGGDNPAALTLLYNRTCERIYDNIVNKRNPFDDFPTQNRKPVQNDHKVWKEFLGDTPYRTHFIFPNLIQQINYFKINQFCLNKKN